jgi:hypothetical protein
MTDLETRLREGLHGDVESPDVDRFLTGVRRGVAWRRGRRASAGIAVLVAAIIGGSVALQSGHDDRTAPRPATQSPSPTGETAGRVVDLVAAGRQVFELVVHDGCTHCSTVLERTPTGDWQRLGTMRGGSARFGPVQQLLMAPDGRNGWAWQGSLWSTHDGGRTWHQVTDGPGRRTIRGHQVAVGLHTAWSVWTSANGDRELWGTPLGQDAWQRVRTPLGGDLVGVTSNGEVVLHETNEGAGGSVNVVSPPLGGRSYPQDFTSDSTFRMGGDSVFAPHGGEVSRLSPVALPDGTWQPVLRLPGRVVGGIFPLDAEHLLGQARAGWYVTEPGGSVRTDLPSRTQVLDVSSTTSGTSWMVTLRGRVYSSTAALHWTPQP